MRQFLWLLPLGMMPGAAVASAVLAPIQVDLTRRLSRWPLKLLVAVLGLSSLLLLTSTIAALPFGEWMNPYEFVSGIVGNAYIVFGILIPWAAITWLSLKDPAWRWWRTSLFGAVCVVAGAIIWLVLGVSLGAATD